MKLPFYVIRSALIIEARLRGQHWRDVYRQHQDIVLGIMTQLQANKRALNKMTLLLPITETVQDIAFDLMQTYALLPTDAYHIAVALDAGVNAFVSLDEDIIRVDDIIVYTCLP
ncbi:MAG: PIN domain-containing protein [Armatimonadetes bacterium]|nr:PIN domain-containing protein [Armatimonadota bacterium]